MKGYHIRKHMRRMRKTGTTFTAGRYEYNFAEGEVISEFRSIAKQMWGAIVDQMTFQIEPEETGVLAYLKSLKSAKRRLIGDHLIQAKKEYTLGVSSKFYGLSKEDQRKILVHEVAHIGCRDHDRLFRKKVLEAGGVLCSQGLEHNKVFIKAKLKSLPASAKYATLEEFSVHEYDAAQGFAKDYALKHPDYRVRLTSRA